MEQLNTVGKIYRCFGVEVGKAWANGRVLGLATVACIFVFEFGMQMRRPRRKSNVSWLLRLAWGLGRIATARCPTSSKTKWTISTGPEVVLHSHTMYISHIVYMLVDYNI